MKKILSLVFALVLASVGLAQQYNVTATPAGIIKPLPNGATVKTPAGGTTGQIQWNNAGVIGGFTATGDLTIVPSTGVVTLEANVVTNAKAAQVPSLTLKGNATGSPGNQQDLNATQAKSLLAITSADVSGLGSIASQNSNSVNISGGVISGANVTGLAPPVLGTDAVNLNYVGALSAGITPRTGVAVATTANITLSGEQTIDGVITSASRILVKNQSSTLQNGIYVTGAGAWSRASDSNTAAQLKFGYYYFVSGGTTQAATSWFIQTAPTVLNTDPVLFAQFSASQNYSAGTGLLLGGNVFSLNPSLSGLSISASAFNGSIGGLTPSTIAATTLTASSVTATGAVSGASVSSSSHVDITHSTNPYVSLVDGSASSFLEIVSHNLRANVGGANQFVVVTNSANRAVIDLNGLAITGSGTFTSASVGSTALNINNTSVGGHSYQFYSLGSGTGTPGYFGLGDITAGTNPLTVDTSGKTTLLSLGVTGAINAASLTTTGSITSNGLALLHTSGGITTALTNDGANGAVGTSTNHPFRLMVNTNTIGLLNGNGITVTGGIQGTGLYNVRAYGAKGDGSTNDTSFIANAISDAKAYHGAVYFPAGVYMTDLITITGCTGLTIYGDGIGVSKIKARSPSQVLNVSSSTNINVHGLTFDGSCTVRTAGQQAVIFDTTVGLDFNHNEIINSGEFALFIGYTSASNVIVSENLIGNNWADGINIGKVTNYIVANNRITGADDDGIAANGSNGVVIGNFVMHRAGSLTSTGRGIWSGGNVTNLLIIGNTVKSVKQHGIYINQEDTNKLSGVKIIGNMVINSPLISGQPIALVGTQDCTVENNSVYDPPIAVSGLIEIANWDNLKISGNKLYQHTNSLFARGIHVDEGTGYSDTTWSNLTLKGNEVYFTGNSTSTGIYLQPNVANTMDTVIIDSNTVKQLGGVGNYISLSGVTTTMGKIFNNSTMTAGATITPSTGGVFTVSNNY